VIDLLERVHAQLGGVVLMATTDEANSDYYYDYQADKNAKPPSSNGKVGQPTVENRNGAGTIFTASARQPGPVAPVDEAAQP
jgi:hypothetical protein